MSVEERLERQTMVHLRLVALLMLLVTGCAPARVTCKSFTNGEWEELERFTFETVLLQREPDGELLVEASAIRREPFFLMPVSLFTKMRFKLPSNLREGETYDLGEGRCTMEVCTFGAWSKVPIASVRITRWDPNVPAVSARFRASLVEYGLHYEGRFRAKGCGAAEGGSTLR